LRWRIDAAGGALELWVAEGGEARDDAQAGDVVESFCWREPQVREADGDGFASFDMPPACPAFVLVEWTIESASEPYRFSKRVVPQCNEGTEDHQARSRLHNIGYEMDWPLEVAVSCFQADYRVDHLPQPLGLENGKLPPATAALLEDIYIARDCDATP
jgi:hypothetical protein